MYASTEERNITCEVLCDYVSYAHTRLRIEIEIAEGDEMAELNHRTGSCARSYVAARTHLPSSSFLIRDQIRGADGDRSDFSP